MSPKPGPRWFGSLAWKWCRYSRLRADHLRRRRRLGATSPSRRGAASRTGGRAGRISATPSAAVFMKSVSGGVSGSRQRFTPAVVERRRGTAEGVERRSRSACSRVVAGRDVPLDRRAEDEDVAAQVAAAAGQLDEVVGGPLADRRVGRGEVEALGLRQQPVQADDRARRRPRPAGAVRRGARRSRR